MADYLNFKRKSIWLVFLFMLLSSCGGHSFDVVITETSQPTETTIPTVTPIVSPETPISDEVLSLLLFDDMAGYDTALWHKADGWTNGNPFWVGWRADHVEFLDDNLILRLDNHPCIDAIAQCSGQPYASGEYRTNEFFQYGCVEGRMKVAQGDGVVTSLFTYTGPSDGNPHDEIDIEILGKNTTQLQINYYVDGVGGHEKIIDLGFDATQEFHVYSFEWLPDAIYWRVDGELVHTETGNILPTTPGRVMANLWPGTGVDGWLNAFDYPNSPIYAYYDWIKVSDTGCIATR